MRKIIVFMFGTFLLLSVCVGITSSEYQARYVEVFTPDVIEKPLLSELFIEPAPKEVITKEEKVYDGTVYLTFDDGPVPSITSQILDTLNKYNVKATFFMIGSYAKNNPDMVKRVYDEGHTVGCHSYTHKKSMFSSLSNFQSEIEDSVSVLEEIIGDKVKFFRIPYGTKINNSFSNYLANKGLSVVKWNCESYDSRVATKTPEQILEGVKSTKPSKGDVIVIMHDTYGKQKTVDALPSVIEYFQSINYEFKRFQ